VKPATTLSVCMQLLAAAWAIATVPVALILLFVAVTWTGRSCAAVALLAGTFPILAVEAWGRGRERWRGPALAVGGAAAAMLIGLGVIARSAGEAVEGRAQVVTARGFAPTRAWAGRIVPEVDQLMLGFTLAPAVDPLFSATQAAELRRSTASIYRELDAEPGFHALDSMLPAAAADFWSGDADRGQSFLYVPAGLDRTRPHGALIFLHGAGGNWKGYLWVLAKVADQRDMVVIAPSFGFGRWREPDTSRVVERALDACAGGCRHRRT